MHQLPRFTLVLVILLGPARLYGAQAGHLTQLTFEAASTTANPGALPEASAVSGSCTRTTTNCATGTGCYRWNPVGQICNATKTLTLGQAVVRASVRFRVAAFPGVFGKDFFGVFESFYGTGVSVQFTNTDQLSVFSYGSGGATDTCGPLAAHVAPNTWYAVRLRAQKSDTATVSLDVFADDGTLLDSVTCTGQHAGGGSFTTVRVGSGNGFGASADINIDDVDVHDDTGWPGNVRWTYLEPTSNASCSAGMTGCSGSGNQWQCVDENPPSDGDTTYLTTSTTGACTFNHPTAASKSIVAPIHGTLLWWNAKQTSGTVTLAGRLGSTNVAPQALTASYADFFSFNATNPATGLPWTTTTLNGTAFGFRKTTAGAARVTESRWIVGYEAPTPAPTPTPTPALYSFSTSFDHPVPSSGDAFGDAVTIAGGYVAVGVAAKRKVYVYDHFTGALLLTISSPNGDADLFGISVAGIGEDIIVGAPLADTAGVDSGSAYLYDGVTGALLTTYRNPSPAALDNFGISVASLAPYVLVGADGDDTQGANAGAAYLFDQNDPAPVPAPVATFFKPAPIGTSAFGSVVGAAGAYPLVGDPADASGAGAIFVFDAGFFSPTFGLRLLTIPNPFPAANDNFGSSLTGIGSYFLVGGPGDDSPQADSGAAYLFDAVRFLLGGAPNPNFGALVRTLANPSPAIGDRFGASVASARGAHAAVGAPYDDGLAVDAGAVYLINPNTGTNDLTLTSPLSAAQATQALFGSAVDGGRAVLVGAPQDSSTFANAGRAYLFERGVPFCADSEPDSLTGAWTPVQARPAVAVHSVLASSGKVQFWQGSEVWYLATDTFSWDPTTGALTQQTTPSNNLFCAGHATLEDGRTIVIGGTLILFDGIATAFAFDPTNETWTRLDDMEAARWYPTATTLGDGRILATSGHISGGVNANTPEVYDPSTNLWTSLSSSATLPLPLYPHMFVLPNGKVFQAGADGGDTVTRTLDLMTQTWSVVGNSFSGTGSSAMYEPGKVLKSGGFDPGPNDIYGDADDVVTANTGVIDMNVGSPAWRAVSPMSAARLNHNLVVLPDGTVLAVGGSGQFDDPAQAVLPAELWKPSNETWNREACMATPRMYHSSAVLLPDARVLSQGGNDYPSYQIYTPPYLFAGTRPTITSAPVSVIYGESFSVQTPEAGTVTSVVFVRPGAATHAFDENQRRVPLSFVTETGTLTVTAPIDGNTAPPGYYMLFLINSTGTPSVAKFVQLKGCG